jgi:diguanylate cyclase (GGDEF)-like protein
MTYMNKALSDDSPGGPRDGGRRRGSIPLAYSIALFLVVSFLPARPSANASPAKQLPSPLPTLTTARQVHDLTSEEASRHYPVHLRAVCIICFSDWHGLFVNDGATGVYVETKNQVLLTAAIHPGTLLDIVGITSPGEYAPIVDQSSLRVLGERPLPPARPVSLDRLSAGVEDGQWITFEGTVRSVELRDSMVALEVASGRLRVEVMTTPGSEKEFSGLIYARVRVRGAAGPIFNQRRQLIGVNVYSPSLDNIQVLQPAPADPFSIPLRPVRSVFAYTPGTAPDHLVHIRGVVSARLGQTVFINDGVQGASVLSAGATTLKPGEVVDAVGYPVLGDTEHTIDDAIFRRLGTSPLPEAKRVTVKEALAGDYEGDLVRLDGRLIEQQKESDQVTLLMEAGGIVFSAVLPGELRERVLAGLRDGSEIQLTGICVISETKAERHFRLPKAFQILLRSPSDVVVIKSPSWWTPAHAFLVLALALAGTLIVLVWLVALKRQVRQQTNLLREQAELLRESEQRFRHMALHDALTGLATRLLLEDRLDAAVETANRHQTGLALLMVDLDRFKETNDTFGHQAGDEVLRVTADRLLEAVRKSDTVARIGGDEFVVLLADLRDPQIAERIAANIVETLAVPISFEGREMPVTVSVGVCAYEAGKLDADTMLKNVDVALYSAKKQGRNCFVVFTPELAGVRMEQAN